jgi:hypothetical protein
METNIQERNSKQILWGEVAGKATTLFQVQQNHQLAAKIRIHRKHDNPLLNNWQRISLVFNQQLKES